MQMQEIHKLEKNSDNKWYKGIVLYRFNYTIYPLFLQIVVDFLRNTHLQKDDVEFNDIFRIDYENNIIEEKGVKIDLSKVKVDVDSKEVKKKLSFFTRAKLKAIKDKFEMQTIRKVYDKLHFNFYVYAKYGFLRVEYSLLKSKLAIIFYTQHKGMVKRMKDNRKALKRSMFSAYQSNISIFITPISESDLEKELEEKVLKEVDDIIHT